MHKVPELLEEIVYPGTLENCNQCVEEIGEMSEQLRKQVTRIKELRKKKVEEPGNFFSLQYHQRALNSFLDAFYGMEDTQLHNVDVMTDVSQPYTAFTRYTAAPTALSKTSSKFVFFEL
jgi:elongator complex protein 1